MSRAFVRGRGGATALVGDETAATFAEYALMLCLIALVAMVAVSTLGMRVGGQYGSVSSALSSSGKAPPKGFSVGNGVADPMNPNC